MNHASEGSVSTDFRPVSGADDYRVPRAIGRMGPIARELVLKLGEAGVAVLGADCPCEFWDGKRVNVDLRLRHRKEYPYGEMKWSRVSTEAALLRAYEQRETLRKVVREPATLCLAGCVVRGAPCP